MLHVAQKAWNDAFGYPEPVVQRLGDPAAVFALDLGQELKCACNYEGSNNVLGEFLEQHDGNKLDKLRVSKKSHLTRIAKVSDCRESFQLYDCSL